MEMGCVVTPIPIRITITIPRLRRCSPMQRSWKNSVAMGRKWMSCLPVSRKRFNSEALLVLWQNAKLQNVVCLLRSPAFHVVERQVAVSVPQYLRQPKTHIFLLCINTCFKTNQ